MKTAYLLISAILLASCSHRSDLSQQEHTALSEQDVQVNASNSGTYDLLTVEIGTPIEQMTVNQKHLYGKFFNDRAVFYVIENPELYVSNTQVKELTLYFIDGMLCKKKYLLQEDISNELIKTYGGFKFRPLNHRTRDISQSENIIVKNGAINQINDHLERYQMRWNEEEVMIKYMLRKDSIDPEVRLEEELSAYKYLLRTAELSI